MSLYWRLLIGVVVLTFSMPAPIQAQGRGRGMMQGMTMGYDQAKEATVSGTVTEVVEQQSKGMGMGGLHLTLEAGDDTIDVHLGPKSWMDSKGYTFAKGDALTVTGSRSMMHDMATMTNKDTIVAREIKKGDEVMTLRDENGKPMWSGGMNR